MLRKSIEAFLDVMMMKIRGRRTGGRHKRVLLVQVSGLAASERSILIVVVASTRCFAGCRRFRRYLGPGGFWREALSNPLVERFRRSGRLMAVDEVFLISMGEGACHLSLRAASRSEFVQRQCR